MHHSNGKLPLVATAAPNHTPPYVSSIHHIHGISNAGYLNNDWGAKPGLVASERAGQQTSPGGDTRAWGIRNGPIGLELARRKESVVH